MGRSCEVCGRGTVYGNHVSHSNKKTRRKWKINLVSMKGLYKGSIQRMRVCTRCLRSNKVIKKV